MLIFDIKNVILLKTKKMKEESTGKKMYFSLNPQKTLHLNEPL